MDKTLPFEEKAISDDELLRRMTFLRPVFSHRDGNLHFLAFDNTLRYARDSSYIWKCESAGLVRSRVQPRGTIRAYSRYGYVGFFKPSLAEVFAYVPENLLDQFNSFEITDSPDGVNDLSVEMDIINAGYHPFTVSLYWIEPEGPDNTILGRDFLTI